MPQAWLKNNDKIKIVTYVDGPFFPNRELTIKEQQKELNKGLYFDREKLNATNKKIYALRQERQERINIARRKEQEQDFDNFITGRIK